MNSTNNQKIVIGYAVIDQSIDKKLIQNQKVNKILAQSHWYINDRKYQKYNWAQIFKLMIQAKAEKIYLQGGYNMHILKQIQHVCFSQLKQLWICTIIKDQGGNCIQNIQSMTWIQFQQLQVLSLGQSQFNYNYITQIKCFDKVFCPQIRSIFLNGLPLNQIKLFVRSRIFCRQDTFNNISLQSYSNYAPIEQDLSILVKLQTKSTFQIGKTEIIIEIGMESRIKNQKVFKMLHNRFPKFYPYYHDALNNY